MRVGERAREKVPFKCIKLETVENDIFYLIWSGADGSDDDDDDDDDGRWRLVGGGLGLRLCEVVVGRERRTTAATLKRSVSENFFKI